jgi:ADP-heptose:LPS heptosyltransferase
MPHFKNILLIRLKSIGDVVLTLPAVHVVRENFPAAKITFLTSRENTGLLEGFQEVDEVIALDRAALRSPNPLRIAGGFLGLLGRLRGRKFDLAVDFQGYGETAWLARITGAAQRWGCVHKNSRRWAYTIAHPRVEEMHPAAGHLQLLKDCGLKIGPVQNQFQLPAAALAAARQFFAEQKINHGQPVLFLQPFTSSPHKDWPLENFLAVARHFQARGGAVIFGGGPSDRDRLKPAQAAGFSVAAGQPLLVTGGLMKLSRLIIGGDTGVVHLAVAMGNRVIMLMHRMDPGAPSPFSHDEWAIRPLPRGQGVEEITVDRILAHDNLLT